MLDLLEKPHRSADEDKGCCAKAKNGSGRLLARLRRYHGVVVDNDPKPVLVPIEPINEPVDQIKVWAERQKSIPIKKAPWFSVEKDLGPVEPSSPRIEEIIEAVAKYYRVRRNDMISARRDARVVRTRMVGYFLAKALTLKSLPEIGRRFGGRDHTSILSGIRKIERLRQTDTGLEMDLRVIAASLGGSIGI